MNPPITEITALDPERVDAVPEGANGFPVLLMKSLDDADPQYRESVEMAGQDDYDEDDDTAEKMFCGDEECPICASRLAKGKLSAADRKRMPKSDFAIPEKAPGSGSYPVGDKSHARNALSRVSQFGSPKEKKRVRAAVHAKFPGIGGKKKAAKATPSQDAAEARAREFPQGEAASQTHEVMGQQGAISMDTAREGDRVNPESHDHLADSLPQGGGDTAPDKTLPEGEALSQTHEVARKGQAFYPSADGSGASAKREVDMGGTKAGSGNDGSSKRKAASQTRKRMRKGKKVVAIKAGDSDYAGGEQHDIALGEAAGKLLAQAQELVGELTQHERAEGEAYKAVDLTSSQSEQALAQARDLLAGLTQNMRQNTIAAKELDDMTVDELRGLLDERDANLMKSLEKKLNKKSAKKAKKSKGKKGKAAKATAPTPLVDTEEIVRRAAEAAGTAVKAVVEPLEDTVNRMAKEKAAPRPRPALSEKADPKAVLRDQTAAKAAGDGAEGGEGDPVTDGNALKALEENFQKATDPSEKERLGRELTTARFVIAERQRHGGR